jgi:hypothetical protein
MHRGDTTSMKGSRPRTGSEPISKSVQDHERVTGPARDVLSPREIAGRAGFSYHAILRAIRRGDLQAFEPIPGHYRITVDEYERWLHTPARPPHSSDLRRSQNTNQRSRARNARAEGADPGSFTRLTAIEGNA